MRSLAITIVLSILTFPSLFGQEREMSESWTIDSVFIPDCPVCKEMGITPNILLTYEIKVGYKVIFSTNFIILDNNLDTLGSHNYRLTDDKIEVLDFDTYDSVKILTKTDSQMILKDYQRIVRPSGEDLPRTDLLVFLTRE